MSLTVNPEVQHVQGFFQHLASPDFNDKIYVQTKVEHSVKDNRVSSELLYKVRSIAKYHWLNPLRFVPFINGSESAENKIKLATNLLGMVKKHEKSIAALTNLDDVIANLGRIAERIVRNTEGTDTEKIQGRFNEAIAILAKAQVQHFATNRGSFEKIAEVETLNFYNQLSNTGWFGKVGGFNQRVHVKEPIPYRFEVYTSPKLSFKQKLFGQGKAVSGAEKVATAQNLAKMITADAKLIRRERLNVTGMVTNLQALKGRITRNTVESQSAIIEKALDGAINDLKKLDKLIEKDRNNSLMGRLKSIVKDWIVLPVPKLAWRWTGGWAIDSTIAAKDAAAIKLRQLIRG